MQNLLLLKKKPPPPPPGTCEVLMDCCRGAGPREPWAGCTMHEVDMEGCREVAFCRRIIEFQILRLLDMLGRCSAATLRLSHCSHFPHGSLLAVRIMLFTACLSMPPLRSTCDRDASR